VPLPAVLWMPSSRPTSDDPRLAADLQARTIEAAYRLLPPGLLLTVIMAIPFALLFRRAASTWAIIAWVAAQWCVSGTRYLAYRRFFASEARATMSAQWTRRFELGFVMSGLAWGILGTQPYHTADSFTRSVLSLILAGIAAIGVVTAGPITRAYRLFVACMFLPVVTYKFWTGDPDEVLLGALCLLFGAALVVVSQRASENAVGVIRSQLAAEQLAADLANAVEETEVKNAQLQQEMAQRARAQEATHDTEARLRLALESAGMHTWEYDLASETVLITASTVAVPPAEAAPDGRIAGFVDYAHPEDQPALREAVAGASRVGDTIRAEFRLPVGDQWRWMRARGRVVEGEGGTLRMIGVTQDVTRRRIIEDELREAMERANAASEAKSQFLANMSHEIRTPLNGVVGMLELLADTTLAPQQQRMAQAATRSSEALLGVINNILDLSKIEANRLELEALPFDVRRLAEDASAMLADAARRKGIELACRIEASVPMAVIGDPNRVRQVLLNLVANAVKFTEQGEVEVSLERLPDANTDAARLRFAVRDTGIGLSAEESARLFRAFSQADMSTSRRFGGTGLGLAIARQLVELMEGTLELVSEPGAGSTFTFTVAFPLADALVAAPVAVEALHGRRVLVVEDNVTNREILKVQCEAFGMQVECVGSAEEGLATLRAADAGPSAFDVVLLDQHLPGMSGLELVRALEQRDDQGSLRIVLLTSGVQAGDLARARASGVVATLDKPVRRDDLLAVLRSAVQGRATPLRGMAAITPTAALPGSTRVLVVEDNEVNRYVVQAMLGGLGCQVTLATGGEQGVELASTQPFDLILMDCQMPVVDGFEATRRIRYARVATPIIALTANALHGDRERCLEAGMDDYLAKPFSRAALRETLRRWLITSKGESMDAVSEGVLRGTAPAVASEDHGAPVFDPSALADLDAVDVDGSLVTEVVALYQTDGGKLVEALRSAWSAGEVDAVRIAAHTLKSSSGYVGARAVMALAIDIELLARVDRVLCSESQLQAMESAYATVCKALTSFLHERAVSRGFVSAL
jgi:two-component system, sensor histidine kinase and response regulator